MFTSRHHHRDWTGFLESIALVISWLGILVILFAFGFELSRLHP